MSKALHTTHIKSLPLLHKGKVRDIYEVDDQHLLITFEDNGSGIAEENLPHIFDPFFTTKDVGEGTGLGLAVTYSLVQRMNGTITVESREGEGTRFDITLPIDEISRGDADFNGK